MQRGQRRHQHGDLSRESADHAARAQGCPAIECGATPLVEPLCFKGKCAAYVCDFLGCQTAGPTAECASDDDCPGTTMCFRLHCAEPCTADAECRSGVCDRDNVCRFPHGCNGVFGEQSGCSSACLGVCTSGAVDAGADD